MDVYVKLYIPIYKPPIYVCIYTYLLNHSPTKSFFQLTLFRSTIILHVGVVVINIYVLLVVNSPKERGQASVTIRPLSTHINTPLVVRFSLPIVFSLE